MKKIVSIILLCLLCAAFTNGVYATDIEILRGKINETLERDGAPIAELAAEFPQLHGMDDQDAMNRVNEAIQDFVRKDAGFGAACEYALGDYVPSPEGSGVFTYRAEANAQAELLADDTLLAVRYDLFFDGGGAHPWNTIATQHFDLETGARISLDSLAYDPWTFRARVSEEFLKGISETGFSLFDEAEATIREWPFEQGLLTDDGLLAFFNEGEIGPVSEGPAEVLIPYDQLRGILR